MAKLMGELQDQQGNVLYPHTSGDVVFLSGGETAEQVKVSVGNLWYAFDRAQKYKLTTDSGDAVTFTNGDLNNLKTSGMYIATDNVSNKPNNSGSWFFVEVIKSTQILQRATNDNGDGTFVRSCFNGTWTAWREL